MGVDAPMARLSRIDVPDVPQHLIVRGCNRCDLFRDETDRWIFMNRLEKALTEWGCDLHAYVFMSNHVHLLATGREYGAISRMMHLVETRFARFVNLRHQRTGPLFEGRFHSSLVDSATYFLTCMQYIELNPVRAGMVAHPSQHGWSSYRANAGGSPSGLLAPHDLYLNLGEDPAARAREYVRLFDEPITETQLAAIRSSARRSRALGSPAFLERMERELGRPVGVTPHGGERQSSSRGRVTK
jgi:putative transposase